MKTEEQYFIAIETTSKICSVCIGNQNVILANYTIYKSNLHDKMLALLVQRLLNDLSLKADLISAIFVSAGPGSYTGLRIAMSFAKGFCIDGMSKLLSINTIEAIAYSKIKNTTNFLAIKLYSHADLSYFSIWDKNLSLLFDIKLLSDLEINETLENFDDYEIIKINENNLECYFNSSIVYHFGLELFNQGRFDNVIEVKPQYFSEFVPKMKLNTE